MFENANENLALLSHNTILFFILLFICKSAAHPQIARAHSISMLQMNGLCGSTATASTASTIPERTSICSGIGISGGGGGGGGGGVIGGLGGGTAGTGSPIRRGGAFSQATGSGPDAMRKSRSQGGKKLQKCLSTASYGEELSISRPQMTPLSHNLLMTRQYCSFGSTTSSIINVLNFVFQFSFNLFCVFNFKLFFFSFCFRTLIQNLENNHTYLHIPNHFYSNRTYL